MAGVAGLDGAGGNWGTWQTAVAEEETLKERKRETRRGIHLSGQLCMHMTFIQKWEEPLPVLTSA